MVGSASRVARYRSVGLGAWLFILLAAHDSVAQSCSSNGAWPTCTTWAGPQLVRSPGSTTTTFSYNPIDSFDLAASGLNGFAQLMGDGSQTISASTGSTFNTQTISLQSQLVGSSYANCYAGNFDGSGRTGVACPQTGEIQYATSNGTGLSGFVTASSPAIPSGNIWSMRVLESLHDNANYAPNACLVMDVDGDGTDDLVCGGASGSVPGTSEVPYLSHSPSSTQWGVYLSTGNGFTYQTWTGPAGAYSLAMACVQGEFDGDGLADLACHYGSGTTWTILHSTGTGWAVETWPNGPNLNNNCGQYGEGCSPYAEVNGNLVGVAAIQCVPGDFNGDGLTDVACVNSDGSVTIGFTGASGKFMSTANWAGVSQLASPSFMLPDYCAVSDLFGVGRAGIICNFSQGSSNWTYLASTGSGFNVTNFTTSFAVGDTGSPGLGEDMGNACIFADLDGDGIKDIACAQPTLSYSGYWNVALSSRPN